MNSIWGGIANQIKLSRKVSTENFNKVVDNLDATLPVNAFRNNIVDGIVSKTQYKQKVKRKLGIKPDEN